MKKKPTIRMYLTSLVFIFFLVSSWHAAWAQNCPATNYTLTSQAEVDAFPAGCTTIVGDLTIGPSSDITDLSPLANITSINGFFRIRDNDALTNLDGLSGITSVERRLGIEENKSLVNINGLSGLNSVGRNIEIINNDELITLDGLSGITTINSLYTLTIVGNSSLTNLQGLENLNTAYQISIISNPALINLSGLDNLSSVFTLAIRNNASFTSLSGMPNLSSLSRIEIRNNSSLPNMNGLPGSVSELRAIYVSFNEDFLSFEGFTNVNAVLDTINIRSNPSLTDLDELLNITSAPLDLIIFDNPSLQNLNGLANLSSLNSLELVNNTALQNLDGLSNVECARVLRIENNTALTDCCGIVSLIDEIDDGVPGPGTDPMPDIQFGVSISGNGSECTTVAEILTPPTAVCKNATITFGIESELALDPNNLWDEAASSTNCPDLWVGDYFPTEIDCSEIGNTVPVTLTIVDESGKTAGCIANVTVDGLTCGWAEPEDGVGCPGGSGGDFSGGTFTVSSDGCYDPSFYSSSDAQGMIASELCGDGEIIAEVTNVTGNGFGGVSMRESMAPDAKMLQLMIDGVMLTRRELRTSTGGIAYAHVFQTQGKNWLRLTRSGSSFGAYHSSDGVSWSPVLITTIDMGTCISVGLMSKSNTADGEVEATFENVFITGLPASLAALPATFDIAQETPTAEHVRVYPNPATDELFVDLPKFQGRRVHIQVLNGHQQVVQQLDLSEETQTTRSLDISGLVDGVYYLRVLSEGQRVIQKFVKMD